MFPRIFHISVACTYISPTSSQTKKCARGMVSGSISSWGASDTSGRVANASFEYIFRRAECLQGYARDSNNANLFGDLRINSSSVTCNGLGVEAKPNIRVDERIVSLLDSSRFMREIDSEGGWTFEMWATFEDFSECPMCNGRHIASIGSTNKDLIGEACSTTSNLLLLQTNLVQSIAMEESTTSKDKACTTRDAPSVIDWGVPVHAVFTSTTSGIRSSSTADDAIRITCWYLNGLQVGCVVEPNQAFHWQDGFHLQMLNDAVAVRSPTSTSTSTYAASGGSIFLVAMYNRLLSDSEVTQNFQAGLENSPPVAENVVVTINEDGEIGDHYDTPSLYLQDPMVPALNLPVILLLATDIDQQEGFPGFDSGEELVLPSVYIASLPSRGTLYDIDGEAIKNVSHFVVFNDGYPVRYRPDKDESSGLESVYTSFTYNAVDGVTGETSVVPGIVDIHVLPKNDPPLPSNTSTTVQTGETLLFLGGTDVDNADDGDTIFGFLIVEPPTHGVLHQVFDNLTRSSIQIERGHRLLGQFVSYIYTGNVSRAFNTFSEEMLVHDKLSYRLYDSSSVSTIGTVSLAITSRLKAVTAQSRNDSSWICVEDTEKRIVLYAEDTAESPREVTIVLTAVPEQGSLRRIDTNATLSPGDTLSTTCTEPLTCVSSVRYLPKKDYFNWPTSRWNGEGVSGSGGAEYLSFFAVANDTEEYSNEVVQKIQVINSNDPSGLWCPTQPHHVQAVGISVYSSGTSFVPLDREVIQGFSIVDPDNGVDIVKVKVSTLFGLLSLNMNHISLLDFNSATYCYDGATSRCFGSGTSDRDLCFFAEPRHAQMALDGMVYQSVVSNVRDHINVTIFDGINGDCLDEGKFQPGPVRQNCWNASCQFHVMVGGHSDSLGTVPNSGISVQVWMSLIIGLCVFVCLGCGRCAFFVHKQCFRASHFF